MRRFTCEQDVRKWMKKQFGDRCFWIEQAPGGTVGFPDVTLVVDVGWPMLVPVELKCTAVGDKGQWKPTLRPSQRNVGKMLTGFELLALVVVGEIGTGHVWLGTMADCLLAMEEKREAFLIPVDKGERISNFAKEFWCEKVKF